MHGYAFNIGDLLRIKPGTIDYITTPADPDKHYTHSLRVVFQFWDGKQNVYVVTAEDGITMFIIEDNAELQEAAPEEAQVSDTVNSRLLDEDTYNAFRRLGILDTSVRSYNRGASDYSLHIIQPWTIWQDYNLNPWDADIVKRILRTKQGDSRRLDYEKIIHICEERIRQIDMEADV
jgi:hypothetical protein